MSAVLIDFIKRRKWWLLIGVAFGFLGALRVGNVEDIEEMPNWLEYIATRWSFYLLPLLFPLVFAHDLAVQGGYRRAALAMPIRRADLAAVLWVLYVLVYPALVPLGALLVAFCDISFSDQPAISPLDVLLIGLVAVSVFGNVLFASLCLSVFQIQARIARQKMAALPKLSFLVYVPILGTMLWQLPVTWHEVDYLGAVAIGAGLVLVVLSYTHRRWLLGDDLFAPAISPPRGREPAG